MSKIKKEDILNDYWDSRVKKGLSRTEREELDDWMVDKYGDAWTRRTKPSVPKRIGLFFKKLRKKIVEIFPKKKEEEEVKDPFTIGHVSTGHGGLISSIVGTKGTGKTHTSPRIKTITAAEASALAPIDGMVYYITSTNGTFSSVGVWTYVSGKWVKSGGISTLPVGSRRAKKSKLTAKQKQMILAVGAVAVIGGLAYMAMKKKKRK